MRENTTPVTVLSGTLGAGKTTVLNHLLAESTDRDIAVLVNEMGEVNVDADLVAESSDISEQEEELVELSNGSSLARRSSERNTAPSIRIVSFGQGCSTSRRPASPPAGFRNSKSHTNPPRRNMASPRLSSSPDSPSTRNSSLHSSTSSPTASSVRKVTSGSPAGRKLHCR